jgi:hypothetical protein
MDSSTSALIVSAVSLLVAGLSLGWQVAQWLLSAARAKAVLLHGVLGPGGAYVGPVLREGRAHDVQSLRTQGATGPEVVGVKVTNHGRAPLVVEGVAVKMHGSGMSLVPIADRIGPELPCRIEPGANATWYTPMDGAKALVSSTREVLHHSITGVYMTAELGTGKTVKTRNALQM